MRETTRQILNAAIVVSLAWWPAAAGAQGGGQPAARPLVAEVEALTSRFAEAVRGGGSAEELTALAGQRSAQLLALMDSAPGEVVRLAVPAAMRDSLPAAARTLTEEHVDVSGTVEVSYEDHRGFSVLRHVLDTGAARYTLHFSSEAPGWTSGQQVRVRGVRVQNALALDSAPTPINAVASAVESLAGEQRTLVMLVNFRDKPATPYTTAFASGVVFGTTDGYLREASAGAVSLAGDVIGWFTINMDSTVCDTTTLATLAKQAAVGAGTDPTRYSRLVYAFPNNACTWWGLGSVGGNPSQAWINGDIELDVAGHELGHNFGLYHSSNMDCGATPIGANCTVNEYGDTLDLMGATLGHFNAFQKERLGWFAASQVLTVSSSGTYAIEPYESLTGGVKALKVLKSVDGSGRRTYYYVEFRQPLGYDAFMSSWPNMTSGVSIHTGSESGGNTTYLLDMTPETASWYDPALTAGRTFTDATAGVSITTLTAGPSGATVSITVGTTATCTRAVPSLSLSPGAASTVAAGTLVTYTVSVTNRDSAACANTAFTLTPTMPAGWTASTDAASLSLAAGATGSTILRVTSPTTAAGGTYSLQVRASDPSVAVHDASASASYSVATTTATTPGAPRSVAAVVSGNTATLSWLAPSAGSLPSNYLLYVGTRSGATDVANGYNVGNVLSAAGDLQKGTYYARVRAANSIGTSSDSNEVRFTVGRRLKTPGGFTVTWSGTTATLSWTAAVADAAADAPTNYVLEAGTTRGASDVARVNVGNRSVFRAEITSGTYFVRVKAQNADGESEPSEELEIRAPGTPQAPTALMASGAGATVDLRWTASVGGFAATSYVIEAGSAPGLSDLARIQVANLTRFTTTAPPGVYYVRVRGVNARGTSLPSNEVVVRR